MHNSFRVMAMAFAAGSFSGQASSQSAYDQFERTQGVAQRQERSAIELSFKREVQEPLDSVVLRLERERDKVVLAKLLAELRVIRAKAKLYLDETKFKSQLVIAVRSEAIRAVERVERIEAVLQPITANYTSDGHDFTITSRSKSISGGELLSGLCHDGGRFSASRDDVYRSMPYGSCGPKGCKSGSTIEEAIRRSCSE